MSLLERVRDPRDLKKISRDDLLRLADEIRQRIIGVVSKTGGHLASSLGVVELAVALHYCFESPEDTIIWDVGHQAYAHKILTGRNDRFDQLRQREGLSGFPSPRESVHDPFYMGHSSTSASLAIGVAAARDLQGRKNKVVAVVGDGALTGGMCFEALNHIGHTGKDILVILNSNDMAIAPSVGALSTYLNKIISRPIFNRFLEARDAFLRQRLGRIGPRLSALVDRFEEMLKGLIVPGIFFEEMGFRYFGPLDGHNIDDLIKTINNLSSLKGPLLLHVVTKKGKGYAHAEQEPSKFHGMSCFDIVSGEATTMGKGPSYTDIFGCRLLGLGQKDERVVAITAAMPEGTGLNRFAEAYPNRFFDVGIAEEHAVGFAAGLAKGGAKPYVAIYSTFLQRAYDQIIEELCLQDLGVVLCVDRAGFVGEDGPTHHGVFDVSYLRMMPRMTVMAPADKQDLEAMMELASQETSPCAIRYPRAIAISRPGTCAFTPVRKGKAEWWRKGTDVTIVALGSMVQPVLDAAEILSQERISVGVVNARFVKPLDEEMVSSAFANSRLLVTIEENVLAGGFGSAVLEFLEHQGLLRKHLAQVKCLGIPSDFMTFDTRAALLSQLKLDGVGIAASVREALRM